MDIPAQYLGCIQGISTLNPAVIYTPIPEEHPLSYYDEPVMTKLSCCIALDLYCLFFQSSTLQCWVFFAASHPSQCPHSLDDLLPEPGAEQAVDEDVDGGVEHEEELRERRKDLHQICR